MAEEISEISVGQFDTVSQLIASSVSLQLAVIGLIIGIIIISLVYRKFSFWVKTQKFNHTRPHVARFARKIILPFLAIALISSVNMYIQVFELFDDESLIPQAEGELAPSEVFAKMLNTLNILVIGYTISQLVPIALTKRDSSVLEREDFEAWREMRGFPDDDDDFFHKLYKWIPPKQKPDDLTEEEFNSYLQTEEGIVYLENFRTSRGAPIGSYEKNIKEPYEKWKKSSSSSGNPLISLHASKSSRSKTELSRFVNAIGTSCEIVYPITKMFRVFSIFANTSLGASSLSTCGINDSSSNNSKT